MIALTANAMAHYQVEYLAAGMDAVVAKPISLALLLQAMNEVMEVDATEQLAAASYVGDASA